MRTAFWGTVAVFASLATTAGAEDTKADPRAVDFCKAKSASFVAVAKCLPDAHVAFKTIDAFDAIYPADAKPLPVKCMERNEGNIVAAATCVTEAINAAIKLKASLPNGTSLDDKVFSSVSDQPLKEKLDAAIHSARGAFPDQAFWGGTMYKPYQ